MSEDLRTFLLLLTPVLTALVGFIAKRIYAELMEQREALKDYVRKEECKLHREQISRELEQIARLRKGS